MSWPVRSRQLAFWSASAAGATFITLGTVPAGKTWLVKDMYLYNDLSVARNFSLVTKQGLVYAHIFFAAAIPSGGVSGFTGRSIVLPQLAQLQMYTPTAGPLQLVLSGAQLG
jgi:hypothetical protein